MKRSISLSQDHLNDSCNIHIDNDSGKMKEKIREDPILETDPVPENSPDMPETTTAVLLDENLLCEQWHRTAHDERLWELICTKHWANIGCGNTPLRSVVLALGGFLRPLISCVCVFGGLQVVVMAIHDVPGQELKKHRERKRSAWG
ncbi:hypothetical protein Hanom_Chr17g01578761 [Helianthus anomalus]